MLRDDTDPKDFKKRPTFEILFVQAKRSSSFGESAIDKFVSVTENLFDLSKKIEEYKSLYNSSLIEIF